MALTEIPSRRLVITGAFAVAIAAPAIVLGAALSAGPPAQLATCLEGQTLEPNTGQCVGTPNAAPGEPGSIAGNPDIPTVDGIPCTGTNSGQCIGLEQSDAGQAGSVTPSSTFGDGN